uniref:Neurotoxin 3FTx-LK n=1 Tax=Bungarus fasciatus TaxID=8613 RepID=3SOIK_BUNFA|nr:RecName: Full=Neurotoxin 3FTx-LK; Flags: Precursor [Bungarus fasciatus]
MKTLLLTLVVVTIVCLDLGYTLKCHTTQFRNIETCQKWETVCFQRAVKPHPSSMIVLRGCTSSCGKGETCCATDLCNR